MPNGARCCATEAVLHLQLVTSPLACQLMFCAASVPSVIWEVTLVSVAGPAVEGHHEHRSSTDLSPADAQQLRRLPADLRTQVAALQVTNLLILQLAGHSSALQTAAWERVLCSCALL